MQSKNHKAKTKAEQAHILSIKEMPCGVCGQAGPSDAHHIKQEMHFLCIPLCKDCHQGGFNGIHGQARIWSVMKKDEMSVLNDTVSRLLQGS